MSALPVITAFALDFGQMLGGVLLIATVFNYRGLDSMMRANDRTLAESERWRTITLLLERLGADLSQPAHRPVRSAAGESLPEWWGRVLSEPEGPDAQIEFSRKSAPGRDDLRLGYDHGAVAGLSVPPPLPAPPGDSTGCPEDRVSP